jgi:hypothetical protein
MLEGIEMPPGVEPLAMVGGNGVNCTVATFTAPDEARPGLAAALGVELARIGCGVQWIDGSTALVRRAAGVAAVTIYDRPDQQLAADGTPRFAEVPPSRLVVQLTAG